MITDVKVAVILLYKHAVNPVSYHNMLLYESCKHEIIDNIWHTRQDLPNINFCVEE